MKWLIIILLIILLLVLWSRYKKLIEFIRRQLGGKKTRLPNEIIVDTQRILDATTRNSLIQWFLDRGYVQKRIFELSGQVRLHLFNRNAQGSVIDLLSGGDEPTMALYRSKIELEGGSYNDVDFNQYLLFPEQRISFPDFREWFKKCAKKRPVKDRVSSQQKGEKDYSQNKGRDVVPETGSGQNQGNIEKDDYCRRITKTKYRAIPAGSTIDFLQGAGPHSIKVGLVDSKADFTPYPSFEDPLSITDPYIQYLQNEANDFDGLNLTIPEAHGTFMSSIIANEYDGDSILKIKSYPFHDGERGYLVDVLGAIYSAVHEGVDILNLSLGYAANFSDDHLQRALNYALSEDVLVICAAGNTNSDNDSNPFWPSNFSSMPNVVSVGATNDAGDRWEIDGDDGSNFGFITVSLASKGVDVLGFINASDKMLLSGTSCAAALITSIAAGIKSSSPLMTAAAIKTALLAQINTGNGIFNSEEPATV